MKRKRSSINAVGGTREWSRTIASFTPGKVCWLRFPGCHVRAETIDHYWPRKYRPDLADVPGNWRPACIPCNRTRRHVLPHAIPELRAKLEAKAGKVSRARALGFFR